MILIRLAAAIRHQNWSQIITEILIVVIGIFLGLQVQEWNEDREALNAEKRMVSYMIEDTKRAIDFMVGRISAHDRNLSAANRVIEIIESGTLNPEDIADFEQGIILSGRTGVVVAFNASFSENNLSQLVDERLRRVIGEYIGATSRRDKLATDNIAAGRANLKPYITLKSVLYQPQNGKPLAVYDFEQLKDDRQYLAAFIGMMGAVNAARNFTNAQLENTKIMLKVLEQYQSGEDIEEVTFP